MIGNSNYENILAELCRIVSLFILIRFVFLVPDFCCFSEIFDIKHMVGYLTRV
jgi:hypothetical protein